ncbi:MAG: hypothetical protein K8U57_04950 [Planctomycetes bacterium]|nr:hypothetical protein [Planctomycetota bacterium]
MSVRLFSAAIVCALLSVVGCTKNATLEVSKPYELIQGEAQAMILDPQPKPQKLNINFTSSEGDILVLVFKDADVPKGEDGIMQVDPKKAIASKKGKSESFTVDVPENTGTQIVMRDAAKKTKVDLKVNNKK